MKKFKLQSKETLLDKFFKVEALKYDKQGEDEPVSRFIVKRPPSSVILLFNKDSNKFVFVKQFRAPVQENDENPFILEVPAGVIEDGEDPKTTIIRETEEETGYHISDAQWVNTCYSTPGIFNEKFHLYYAEVTNAAQKSEGGGVDEESEDVVIVELPVEEVYKMADEGKIIDAKSLTLIYWFRCRK